MDSRLQDSSFFIADWNLCRVSLRNDSTWPWLYLVPMRENVREVFDLTPADQTLLINEMARAAQAISTVYQPDKINTAALGNMVPQLHIHIFGRFKTDIAWPRPVWAIQTNEIPYTEEGKDKELERLKSYFAQQDKGVIAACR